MEESNMKTRLREDRVMDDKQIYKAFEKWYKGKFKKQFKKEYSIAINLNQVISQRVGSEIGFTAGAEFGYKQGRIETLVGVMEFISNTDLETSHLLNYRKIEEYIDTELKKERQSDE